MKKVIYLLLLTLFCCSSTVFSQSNSLADKIAANSAVKPYTSDDPKCTTMDAIEYRIANDPTYNQFYNASRAIPQNGDQARIPCDGTNSIVVPVAFHFAPGVVTCGDSDCLLAEVQDQLDAMNIAFGDNTAASAGMVAACPAAYQDGAGNSVVSTGTCISFCLAVPPAGNAEGLDPACDPPITIGAFTGGFGAGGNGAPGWGGIMNLFIVSDANCLGVADGIPGAGNGDGVSTCASAFGGFGTSAGCGLDTEATYNLGATMVHEIGHYLGLYHTFQGGCGDEPAGPGPFSVTDTPPAANPYFGCNMATCEASGCGNDQGVANFMDYTDDACMNMFTEDQAQVMNYWANQLFGGSNSVCSAASPAELTSACLAQPCVLVCPAVVTAPYAGAEEICTLSGDYTLPTDFSSVVLDDASDAIYSWSTGGYLSAGGTVAGATYTPAPPTCAPEEVTFYLNVDCGTTALTPTLDAGTLVLTVYPDPAAFVITDLVTFTDGDCAVPTWVANPDCATFVTVTPLDEPAAVNTGDMGTVNYDVTLNYPVACCCPAEAATLTETNAATVAIPDNDPANPGCSTVTIPAGSTITDVIVDLSVTHTWMGDMIITLTSPAGTTITMGDQIGVPATGFGCNNNDAIPLIVTFDDAAVLTAADFEAACPPAVDAYQPVDMLSAFDGEDAAGDWTICISDNAGGDTGSITSFGITVETFAPCTDPAGCMLTGTADYTCTATGVGYCDQICFTEYNANPGADDFVDATLCVTPVGCNVDASCEMAQACDDNDPCTINDMETIASDNTVCIPCAGTIDPTSCDAACTSTVACNDNDPCTMGEMETLDADGNVCVPCGGGMAVTPACGDPTATNYDMNATCIDNALCTFGEYCDDICFAEYTATPGANDTPNATLCVTPVSCTGDASCFTTVACDDGDPCTTGETETMAPDGNVCVPCGGGTPVTAACGDPTATNYDMNATCIDNTLCTYASFSFTIEDPCSCNADETYTVVGSTATADDAGTFSEFIVVVGPPGFIITTDASSTNVPVGLVFTEAPAGTYTSATFSHPANVGYTANLLGNGAAIGGISNKCRYPSFDLIASSYTVEVCSDDSQQPAVAPTVDVLATLIAPGDNPNAPTLDIQSANPDPFDPNTGSGTITYTITIGDNGDTGISPDGGLTPAYPGCDITFEQAITVTENDICTEVADIPTVGEWGLIILGLMMSIVAIVGIRARREEEVYG